MTKQAVIRRITEKTGLDPLTTHLITDAFFEVIRQSLTADEPIYIRKFGSFVLE